MTQIEAMYMLICHLGIRHEASVDWQKKQTHSTQQQQQTMQIYQLIPVQAKIATKRMRGRREEKRQGELYKTTNTLRLSSPSRQEAISPIYHDASRRYQKKTGAQLWRDLLERQAEIEHAQ